MEKKKYKRASRNSRFFFFGLACRGYQAWTKKQGSVKFFTRVSLV